MKKNYIEEAHIRMYCAHTPRGVEEERKEARKLFFLTYPRREIYYINETLLPIRGRLVPDV